MKLKGLLRVQPNGRRKEEPQRLKFHSRVGLFKTYALTLLHHQYSTLQGNGIPFLHNNNQPAGLATMFYFVNIYASLLFTQIHSRVGLFKTYALTLLHHQYSTLQGNGIPFLHNNNQPAGLATIFCFVSIYASFFTLHTHSLPGWLLTSSYNSPFLTHEKVN